MQLDPSVVSWFKQNLIISTTYLTKPHFDAASTDTSPAPPTKNPPPNGHNTHNKGGPGKKHHVNVARKGQATTSSTPTPKFSTSKNDSSKLYNDQSLNGDHLACPYCLETMTVSDALIRGDCQCREYKPMHAKCLSTSMERVIQGVQNPTNKVPTFVMKCLHCQTHLLGNDHDKFNTGCLLYRKFVALPKDRKIQEWRDYLPSILQAMETVIENIWARWQPLPSTSYNPVLACALGVMAGCNGFLGVYAADAKASSLAVFGYMMSWIETGPSAMFGVLGVKWVVGMVKDSKDRHNHKELARMTLPIVVGYLIVVLEHTTKEEVQREAQFYLVVVLTERTEHDLDLREVLWQKAVQFLIETANMVGFDTFDDKKIIFTLSTGLRAGLINYMKGREGDQVRLLKKIL